MSRLIYVITLSSVIILATSLCAMDTSGNITVELPEYGHETPLNITQNDRWQMHGAIWGNVIVWEDYRHDPIGAWSSPGLRNSCIYMYDIEASETHRLTHNTSSQVRPDIWENYVVWEDHRHGEPNIYYIDIDDPDRTEVRISPQNTAQITPKIHGGRIVWVDYRDGILPNIYMYDIAEDTETVISNDRHPKRNPDIYGSRIIWDDFRNYWSGEYDSMHSDIFMYDLDGEEEIALIEEPLHQHHASIYRETVTWTEFDGEQNNIYMKQIGRDKVAVTESELSEEDPRIYRGRIVYAQRNFTGGHDSIWLYDIASGINSMISRVDYREGEPRGFIARSPKIYQNHIIWEERHLSPWYNLTYQYDIFYTSAELQPPHIISTSISTDTDEGNLHANMTLKDGAYFTVEAEIIDTEGYLDSVVLVTPDEELQMEETVQNVFSKTVHYHPSMVSGEHTLRVRASDSLNNTVYSEDLKLYLLESPPEITFAGVGLTMDDLGTNVTYTLEDGSSIFFVADVMDPDSDLESVSLTIHGLNITENVFDMEETDTGRYVYILNFQDDMTPGEWTAVISAEDARGNSDESEGLSITAVEPDTEDEGIFTTRNILMISILVFIVFVLLILMSKRRKKEVPAVLDEQPEMDDIDKGVCPNCIEVIPQDSTACPYCKEELEPPEK